MHKLRTMILIDTEREREIGIGEDYDEPEIPFGTCLTGGGWVDPEETEFFKVQYNYQSLFEHYNSLAVGNGWQIIDTPSKFGQTWTRFPCIPQIRSLDVINMKATKH